MARHYVKIQADVEIKWTGAYPCYRVYIGEDLMTERTYYWHDNFLRENIQLFIEPGKYAIKFELLPHDNAQIEVSNMKIAKGAANIKSGWLLRVGHEDTGNS